MVRRGVSRPASRKRRRKKTRCTADPGRVRAKGDVIWEPRLGARSRVSRIYSVARLALSRPIWSSIAMCRMKSRMRDFGDVMTRGGQMHRANACSLARAWHRLLQSKSALQSDDSVETYLRRVNFILHPRLQLAFHFTCKRLCAVDIALIMQCSSADFCASEREK